MIEDSQVEQAISEPVTAVVTLETLSETDISGQNGHLNHPLLTTPTSPRSVTTASMSASGKQTLSVYIRRQLIA